MLFSVAAAVGHPLCARHPGASLLEPLKPSQEVGRDGIDKGMRAQGGWGSCPRTHSLCNLRLKPGAFPETLMQGRRPSEQCQPSLKALWSPGSLCPLRLRIPMVPPSASRHSAVAGSPAPALLLFTPPFGRQQGPGPEAPALPGKIRRQHLTRPLLSSISIFQKNTKACCSWPWAGSRPSFS